MFVKRLRQTSSLNICIYKIISTSSFNSFVETKTGLEIESVYEFLFFSVSLCDTCPAAKGYTCSRNPPCCYKYHYDNNTFPLYSNARHHCYDDGGILMRVDNAQKQALVERILGITFSAFSISREQKRDLLYRFTQRRLKNTHKHSRHWKNSLILLLLPLPIRSVLFWKQKKRKVLYFNQKKKKNKKQKQKQKQRWHYVIEFCTV